LGSFRSDLTRRGREGGPGWLQPMNLQTLVRELDLCVPLF
jgi:hypothetical protein